MKMMGLNLGMWGGGFIGMVLFWIIIVAIAIWALGYFFKSTDQTHSQLQHKNKRKRVPLNRLTESYEQGEITREEYHALLNDFYIQKENDNVY